MNRTLFVVVVAPFVILTASCDDTDERLARFAQESARQQAEQNREMAQLNREVARSHQELISLERDLEKQQAQINNQRDGLESERREIAEQRHRDPIIATAVNNVGVILACLLPLALAGYLLYCFRDQKEDQLVSEILIQEMVSEQPTLLPLPQADMAAVADQRKPTPLLIAQADADEEKNSSEWGHRASALPGNPSTSHRRVTCPISLPSRPRFGTQLRFVPRAGA